MSHLIRPIRGSEADRFLQVLCQVFELDFERAKGVFFEEPFFDLGRKWALFENGEMVSILTTTPLLFGDGKAIGIAGVATVPEARGRGLAEKLLREVVAMAQAAGEGEVMLFAKQTSVYERCGFEVIDTVVKGPIASLGAPDDPEDMGYDDVERAYTAWSLQHHRRLRRDAPRWNLWTYNLKVCEPIGEGYFCFEGTMIREALVGTNHVAWPVPPGTEWYGLANMTEQLGIPGNFQFADLYLMAIGSPGPPQMFMTDQF